MTSFAERLLTPALRGRFAELAAQQAELRILSQLLGPTETAYWIHSIGVCRDAGLARLLPPPPPRELRAAVSHAEPELFLATGLDDARRVHEVVARFGDTPWATVLDFGAGCGRVARFLAAGEPAWRVHACDPDAAHVAWCRENLPRVVAGESPRQPPLRYGDGAFDCVFAVGVFTQLPERSGTAWLAELARVTRPGGLIVVSVHGEAALRTIAGSRALQDVFRVSASDAEDLQSRLDSAGWLFVQHDAEGLRLARAEGEYGVSFVSDAHVRERWAGRGLALLEHQTGGLRGFDDLVVLRHLSA